MECRPLGKLLAVLMSLTLLFGALPGSQPGAQAATTSLPGTGMACFRSLNAIEARLTELVKNYPNLAEIVDIGHSWEKTDVVDSTPGSDLLVLRLTKLAITETKPVMFVVSGLDSRDILGVELNLRFAERLLEAYGQDPNVTMVLDTSEVQLLIVANPDGREKLESEFAATPDDLPIYSAAWGRNRNGTVCTMGVDLTRNYYSFDVTPNRDCGDDYPGPSAESEPETLAIATRLRGLFSDDRTSLKSPVPENTPGLVINLTEWGTQHLVYYPYHSSGFIDNETTGGWIKSLASKLANTPGDEDLLHEAKAPDLTRFGNLLDYAYGKLGVAGLEMRIKYPSYFGRFPNCSQFDDTVVEAWLGALTKAARSTARPYEFAQGPEIASITPIPVLPFSQIWEVRGTVDPCNYQLPENCALFAVPETVLYSKTLPPWHDSAVSTNATYTPNPSPDLNGAQSGTFVVQIPFDPNDNTEQQIVYFQASNIVGQFGLPRAMFLTETTTETKIHILALPLILR